MDEKPLDPEIMVKVRTVEQAKQWVSEHEQELVKSLKACKELPDVMKSLPKIRNLWFSGCWLAEVLDKMGASKQQIEDAQFAQGQQAFFRDPWEVAVAYANEFEANKEVKDKPGAKLAMELCDKHMKG
jgi:hypothetical protein